MPQIGFIRVGAADAELFDFELAVLGDDRVEDLLEDVRVDQVPACFDGFLIFGHRLKSSLRSARFARKTALPNAGGQAQETQRPVDSSSG